MVMSSSFPYVKGSMKNLDLDGDGVADTLTLQFTNYVDTGSANITLKIYVDEEEYTDKAIIKIGGRQPRALTPEMYVESDYGDVVIINIAHKGSVKAGKHKVGFKVFVDWQSFEASVEDIV